MPRLRGRPGSFGRPCRSRFEHLIRFIHEENRMLPVTKKSHLTTPKWILILLFCLSLLPVRSADGAESLDGDSFLFLCVVTEADHENERRFAECERFIGEVRGKLANGPIHGWRACISNDVPDIQLLVAGIARLQAVPEENSREAHEILASLYSKRWPCNG